MKLHESRHPEWAKNSQKWARFGLAYRGGVDYAKASLIRHPRESNENWEARLKEVSTRNYCPMVIDTRTAYIRKVEPEIKLPAALSVDNFDGKGHSAPSVVKTVSDMMQTYGTCFVIVDKPNINPSPQNLAEQIAIGDTPYMEFLTPLEVLNVGLDGEEIDWILIAQPQNKTVIQGGEVKSAELPPFLFWSKEVIQALDKDGMVVSEKINHLGVVPIVPIRYKKDGKAFYGLSVLEDIEPINRNIINSSSRMREIEKNQTFSQLTVEGELDGPVVTDPKTGMRVKTEPVVGTTEILKYREGSKPPAFIAPDPEQGRLILENRKEDIEEIHRLAELKRGSVSQGGTMQSGISKAFDFLDTNQSLSDQAQSISDGLEKACGYMLMWLGLDSQKDQIQITFPHDFGVDAVGELVSELLALNNSMGMDLPGAITELYLNKIVAARFPDLSKKERAALADIIKNSQIGGDMI